MNLGRWTAEGGCPHIWLPRHPTLIPSSVVPTFENREGWGSLILGDVKVDQPPSKIFHSIYIALPTTDRLGI
jgi:hypothetical protein